jgi:ribosomal protein L7/L12
VKELEVHVLHLAQELHARPFTVPEMVPEPEEKWGPTSVSHETPDLNDAERALAIDGRKIEAIKSLRARFKGLGLKEAKDLVENYQRDLDDE